MPNLFEDLIPTKKADNLFADLIPAGQPVKRSDKRVGLTVAAEQQPCCVQVVEWVGLVPPVKELVKELFAPDKS